MSHSPGHYIIYEFSLYIGISTHEYGFSNPGIVGLNMWRNLLSPLKSSKFVPQMSTTLFGQRGHPEPTWAIPFCSISVHPRTYIPIAYLAWTKFDYMNWLSAYWALYLFGYNDISISLPRIAGCHTSKIFSLFVGGWQFFLQRPIFVQANLFGNRLLFFCDN